MSPLNNLPGPALSLGSVRVSYGRPGPDPHQHGEPTRDRHGPGSGPRPIPARPGRIREHVTQPARTSARGTFSRVKRRSRGLPGDLAG